MHRRVLVSAFAIALCGAGIAAILMCRPAPAALAASAQRPLYDKNGNLLGPANYREWVYLTSGIDMSYTAGANPDHSMFDNVFVNREAYEDFLKTGTWPDKTEIVLEVREAKSRGSINLRGHYQGAELMGFEVHVKDEARFPDKWAFFDFDSPSGTGTLIPQKAPCYSCHTAHGAVDTTFVQFYPTLLPIAEEKHTLSKAFVNESADAGTK
jgi:hypothetical protein